jgi:hypothetical protein
MQSETYTTEPTNDISNSKSLLDSLKDFKNPFTIIFYLVCLVALVLLAAVIALLLNRNLDNYDDEDYSDDIDPDDSPPLAASNKKDYYQNFEDLQEPDEETVFSEYVKPEASSLDFPPIARIPVRSSPVADEKPIMGVRAIRFENIPELNSQEPGHSGEQGKAAESMKDNVTGNERVPVRLKQELDAEKLAKEKDMLHDNRNNENTKKEVNESRLDRKLSTTTPTENESVFQKNDIGDQTGTDQSEPDIMDDPDLE